MAHQCLHRRHIFTVRFEQRIERRVGYAAFGIGVTNLGTRQLPPARRVRFPVFHLQKVLGRRYANLMTEDLQAVHGRVSLLAR